MKKIIEVLVLYFYFMFSCVHASLPLDIDNNGKIELSNIPTVIAPSKKATLSSRKAGKIIKLSFREGFEFKQGAVLISFDCDIENALLRKANAELIRAKQHANADKRLVHLGSISNSELADSKANFIKSRADVDIAAKNVSFCHVKAPFSGFVREKLIHNHEIVQLHQPLVSIVASEHVKIEVLVPSDWLSWLQIGQTFKLVVNDTNKSYTAKIIHILKHVNSISQTVKIIGKITEPHIELLPGMSGKSTFKRN